MMLLIFIWIFFIVLLAWIHFLSWSTFFRNLDDSTKIQLSLTIKKKFLFEIDKNSKFAHNQKKSFDSKVYFIFQHKVYALLYSVHMYM
jgi:hypothetical protein